MSSTRKVICEEIEIMEYCQLFRLDFVNAVCVCVCCWKRDLSEEEDECCDMNVMKTILHCSPSDAKVSVKLSILCSVNVTVAQQAINEWYNWYLLICTILSLSELQWTFDYDTHAHSVHSVLHVYASMWLLFITLVTFAPCGLRGCKNWPAPFPGRCRTRRLNQV